MLLLCFKLDLDSASTNTNAQIHALAEADSTGRDSGKCFCSFHAFIAIFDAVNHDRI